jgi:hypothetical protein
VNHVVAGESAGRAGTARGAVRGWRTHSLRLLASVSVVAIMATMATFAVPGTASASTSASVTFNYTGTVDAFTVPAGVTQLTLTITGAEGGQGGPDANGPSPTGGYQGIVSGTIAVNPGDNLSIAVVPAARAGLAEVGWALRRRAAIRSPAITVARATSQVHPARQAVALGAGRPSSNTTQQPSWPAAPVGPALAVSTHDRRPPRGVERDSGH